MGKTFRPYQPEQTLLLPPSLRDWVPEEHLSTFVSDVVDELDLDAIVASYEQGDGRGMPPYDPRMMVKLLVYGYCVGKPSSRKIERATWEDVAFRVLSGDQHPDHDSIAAFRRRHLTALGDLFVQVLQLCRRAGLVKLGQVAIDGTKIKANASRHKAMSYERMVQSEKELKKQVVELLERAQRVDAQEDEAYGEGRRGDELPAELARRESRLRKIQEAKAALEAEAKQRAQAARPAVEARRAAREKRSAQRRGRSIVDPKSEPEPKAQRNFTDPDSRIMLDSATKSYMQAYNAQVAVDSEAQVIVATELLAIAPDQEQLAPMIERVKQAIGCPEQALADAGYFSQAAVEDPRCAGVDLYVPPRRTRHDENVASPCRPETAAAQQMRAKLSTPQGRAAYARRKAIVEPVFGQIKEARGFRRLGLRGLPNVRQEWRLIACTHNLLKLFRSGWRAAA
jgi:transposase